MSYTVHFANRQSNYVQALAQTKGHLMLQEEPKKKENKKS
jgi:hypothetical protein